MEDETGAPSHVGAGGSRAVSTCDLPDCSELSRATTASWSRNSNDADGQFYGRRAIQWREHSFSADPRSIFAFPDGRQGAVGFYCAKSAPRSEDAADGQRLARGCFTRFVAVPRFLNLESTWRRICPYSSL